MKEASRERQASHDLKSYVSNKQVDYIEVEVSMVVVRVRCSRRKERMGRG
jgi:hypothetical protein